MGKVIIRGEFVREGERRYLQQLQFFAHWFWDLLPVFLIPELLGNRTISTGTGF
jgi:hypothetical protein